MIDYVFVNEKMLDRIKDFKIDDSVDSNHIVMSKNKERKKRKGRGGWERIREVGD